MNTIVSLLQKIEEKPLIYLGEKNLRFLRAFIDGYLTCEQENGRNDSTQIFDDFIKYFNNIYGIRSYYDFCAIIRQNCTSDEDAFNMFFKLFADFLNEKSDDDSEIDS